MSKLPSRTFRGEDIKRLHNVITLMVINVLLFNITSKKSQQFGKIPRRKQNFALEAILQLMTIKVSLSNTFLSTVNPEDMDFQQQKFSYDTFCNVMRCSDLCF